MMDIKSFTNRWGGQEGGLWAISVEKNEKITITAPILKLNSTSFSFFSALNMKKLKCGGREGGLARGGQGALSVQKNEKTQYI